MLLNNMYLPPDKFLNNPSDVSSKGDQPILTYLNLNLPKFEPT